MKPNHFVEGGGWTKHQSVGRPKTRLFAMLSLLWLVPSVLAVLAFYKFDWHTSFSDGEWMGVLIPLPEPVFIILTIVYAFVEKPKSITSHLPNPDYDIRNLY